MTQNVKGLLLSIEASTELMRRELVKAAAFTDDWAANTRKQAVAAEAALAKVGDGAAVLGQGFSFLKGAAGGFIAGLTVDSIVQASRAVLNFADDLSTAADQAGIGVERFQTLRSGLRSLEVDAEKQDKIFQRLLTTLGDVQGGTAGKGVVEVLDRMGISSRILNGEIDTTDELLDAIAGAATRYKTEAQFAADVSALVGQKAGPQLAAALKDGGAALKSAEQAFRDTGAVIDTEMVEKLAAANEKWDSFLENTKARTTIWAADILTLAEKVGRGWSMIFDPRASNRAGETGRSALITDHMQAMSDLAEKKAGDGFHPFATNVYEARVRAAAKALNDYDWSHNIATDPLAKLFPLNERGRFGAIPTSDTKDKEKSAKNSTKKPKPTYLDEARDFKFKDEDRSFLIQDFSTNPLVDQATGKSAQLGDLTPKIKADVEAIYAQLQGIAQLPPIKPVDEEGLAMIGQAMSDVSSTMAGAIVFGEDLGDALEGAAKRFVARMLDRALFSLLDGLVGGIFGGGGGFLGSIFGGRRSSGGPVEPGVPYLVGENAPEIFIPTTKGRISPNTGSAGRGGGVDGRLLVEVAPSEMFDVRTRFIAEQSAVQATGQVIVAASRPRMPASRG